MLICIFETILIMLNDILKSVNNSLLLRKILLQPEVEPGSLASHASGIFRLTLDYRGLIAYSSQ